jgi:DNA-binding CsgD family transcriptional regulator/transposase
VIWASVWGREGWNLFVGHVTGGLLYGREVARPAALEGGRVREYRPHVNQTAAKRERVREGLLAGKTVARIAREMGVRASAVRNHVCAILRQERVADRHELARKLGATAEQPLNHVERTVARATERRRRVEALLREGLGEAEIRSRLSIGRAELKRDMVWMYRRHGINGMGKGSRRALAEKLGWPRPETRGEEMRRRRRVAALREAGARWGEAGKALGVSVNGAKRHAKHVDRARVRARERVRLVVR